MISFELGKEIEKFFSFFHERGNKKSRSPRGIEP